MCCQSWIADRNKPKEQQQDLELHFLKGEHRTVTQLYFGPDVVKVTNPHLQSAAARRLDALLQQRCRCLDSELWPSLNIFPISVDVCQGNGDR